MNYLADDVHTKGYVLYHDDKFCSTHHTYMIYTTLALWDEWHCNEALCCVLLLHDPSSAGMVKNHVLQIPNQLLINFII